MKQIDVVRPEALKKAPAKEEEEEEEEEVVVVVAVAERTKKIAPAKASTALMTET
jgi:hypothetical protein